MNENININIKDRNPQKSSVKTKDYKLICDDSEGKIVFRKEDFEKFLSDKENSQLGSFLVTDLKIRIECEIELEKAKNNKKQKETKPPVQPQPSGDNPEEQPSGDNPEEQPSGDNPEEQPSGDNPEEQPSGETDNDELKNVDKIVLAGQPESFSAKIEGWRRHNLKITKANKITWTAYKIVKDSEGESKREKISDKNYQNQNWLRDNYPDAVFSSIFFAEEFEVNGPETGKGKFVKWSSWIVIVFLIAWFVHWLYKGEEEQEEEEQEEEEEL